jgi:hypothetical protein
MWSFLASIVFFTLLVLLVGLIQRRYKSETKAGAAEAEEAIRTISDIAQRRHKQRYGKEDTGLHRTLSGPTPKRGHV